MRYVLDSCVAVKWFLSEPGAHHINGSCPFSCPVSSPGVTLSQGVFA
jgi:hypothetical protein